MIVVVPGLTAVTTPPGLVIVATVVVLLLQVCAPVVLPSVRVVVLPAHNESTPLIGSSVFTVTVVVPVAVIPQASVMVTV